MISTLKHIRLASLGEGLTRPFCARGFISNSQLSSSFCSQGPYNKKDFLAMSEKAEHIKLGKGQFRQLYFPIKRIKFESQDAFAKIYCNPKSATKNIHKAGRLSRLIYSAPFCVYYLNYLFLVNTDIIYHQLALGSMFLGGIAKTMYDTIQIGREIAEMYISADGQRFIAVIPRTLLSSVFNELKGKLKGSQYEKGQCQGFTFSLDDIESVSLRSVGQEKLTEQILSDSSNNLKKKLMSEDSQNSTKTEEQRVSAADTKKNILEKLSKISDNDEALVLTISKPSWKEARTFRVPLKNNSLSQYNDYFVSLGYQQRIVMRESISAASQTNAGNQDNAKQSDKNDNSEQVKEEEKPIEEGKSKENANKAKNE